MLRITEGTIIAALFAAGILIANQFAVAGNVGNCGSEPASYQAASGAVRIHFQEN